MNSMSSKLSVVVSHVDGSQSDLEYPDSLLAKLQQLRDQGLTGKRLVHELLTDDWGPPPRSVRISGIVRGKVVNEVLPYD